MPKRQPQKSKEQKKWQRQDYERHNQFLQWSPHPVRVSIPRFPDSHQLEFFVCIEGATLSGFHSEARYAYPRFALLRGLLVEIKEMERCKR